MAQDVAVKLVPITPLVGLGAGMTEMNRRQPQVIKSNTVLYTDTTTINVFEIPGNVLITDAWICTTIDFDPSAKAAFTIPAATGGQIIIAALSGSLVTTEVAKATGPFVVIPASGGMGVVTYTAGTTSAAGAFNVYMEYIPNADLL